MTNICPKFTFKPQQHGYVVLGVSLILLAVVTLIALFSGQALSTEAKIQNNTFRAQQAFDAAQAGLEYGINYAQTNKATITTGQVLAATQADGSTYSAVLNFVGGNNNTLNIVSTGSSPDGTATRIIMQVVMAVSGSGSIPPGPVISVGSMNMTNSAVVTNKFGTTSIATGGTVSLVNSSETVLASGVSSTAGNIKSDIVQHDAALTGMSSATLQTTYLGEAITSFASVANTTYTGSGTTNYSSKLSGVDGKIIYINQGGTGTAQIVNSVTVGTTASPTTLVVNGNVTLTNSITFNGNIYATGTVTLTNSVTVNGYVFGGAGVSLVNSSGVNGAVVSGGTVSAATNSTFITYSPTILNANNTTGGSNYGKVNGSWQDMNL